MGFRVWEIFYMKAKNPLLLPERLAVLLLEELTDIHALVQTIADMEIQRLAEKIQIEEDITGAKALKKAADAFEAIRAPRAKKFFETQLNRLNLPSVAMS
jgi:2-methylcitrate dehydratase PrpD